MGGQHSQPCAEYGQAACIVKLCAGVCVYVCERKRETEGLCQLDSGIDLKQCECGWMGRSRL